MTEREPDRLVEGQRTYVQTEQRSAADEPSLATLLGDLIGDAQQLMRKEVELAKHELSVEVNKAKRSAIYLGTGGVVAAIGGWLLVLMLVHLLAEVGGLALWTSYLIVGGIFAIIGAILLVRGRSRVSEVDPMPRETIDTLREDVAWIKEQTPSGKK